MERTKTIMVIDDDQSLRETICSVLIEAGYETLAMTDGAEAMEYLSSSRTKPDIILLDLMMPEMDGWRFRETQLMVADSALIPVVVMTSSRDLKDIQVDDVIFKPFDENRLLDVINRHLGGQRESDNIAPAAERAITKGGMHEVKSFELVESDFEYSDPQGLADASDNDRSRLHDTFLDIVCHDLRNPLNSIMLAAGQLSRGAKSEKESLPISRILSNVRQMQSMISQLLQFTRVQSGRHIQLKTSSFDLRELAELVMADLQGEYGNEIRLVHVGECSGTWDKDRIADLLMNLLTNACQYGEVQSPVEIRIDGTGFDSVYISVKNSGVIPESLLPNLFDPMRRALDKASMSKGAGGVGLGLYVCRQIMAAHGGFIQVRSAEGLGTEFIATLPRHVAQLDLDQPSSVNPEKTIGLFLH